MLYILVPVAIRIQDDLLYILVPVAIRIQDDLALRRKSEVDLT